MDELKYIRTTTHASFIEQISHLWSTGAEINEGDANDGVIVFDAVAMIANYFEESGFLVNSAKGHIRQSNDSVLFQPWAVEFDTWEEQFVSLYDCQINDGLSEGGVYFYT